MTVNEIIHEFKSVSNQENIDGMARFGIHSANAFGITMPNLRGMARNIGLNHELALELWDQPYHECKILATLIADPKKFDSQLMDRWVAAFYSWDICDQCIMNLFEDIPYAYEKALEWALAEEEFIRRAGFVMMARLAISDKKADDKKFLEFFPVILEKSSDNRNFVKKAINWAVRQIGKRSRYMNSEVLKMLSEMKRMNTSSGRWIASDAVRELTNEKILKRIKH